MSALAGASVLYVVVVALVLVVSAVVCAERPRALDAALVVCALAALAVSASAALRLLTGGHSREVATHLGYVVVGAVILPLVAGVLRDDSGRWASASWSVACLVLAVVLVRLVATAHG